MHLAWDPPPLWWMHSPLAGAQSPTDGVQLPGSIGGAAQLVCEVTRPWVPPVVGHLRDMQRHAAIAMLGRMGAQGRARAVAAALPPRGMQPHAHAGCMAAR
jgi:hypothetical protein